MEESRWAPQNSGQEATTALQSQSFSTISQSLPTPQPLPTVAQSQSFPAADEFAQTREPDNLFDDDITPISEPINQPIPPEAPRSQATHYRPRSSVERGTYRGGRGGRGGSHLNPRKTPEQIESSTSKLPTAAVESTTAPTDPTPTPTGPAQTRTTFAARGNRLPTGGIQKPKLTEEELSAKLAAAKLNNAKREEAHRVAEADAASFQRREELAREKRKEEGVARRVMEGEREKNRQRKLAGRGGREWDEGKEEVQDKESGRGSNFRRGMHGGVGPRGGSGRGGFGYQNSGEGNVIEEGEGRGRGRGRNRGRGGRGRGDTGDAKTGGKAASFVAEDFPALEPKKTETPAKGEENVKSPVEEKGSWAEQMNSAGT